MRKCGIFEKEAGSLRYLSDAEISCGVDVRKPTIIMATKGYL